MFIQLFIKSGYKMTRLGLSGNLLNSGVSRFSRFSYHTLHQKRARKTARRKVTPWSLCRHTHCVCCRHLLLNLRNICVPETVLSLEQLLMGTYWGPHEQLLLPAWITCHEGGLILRVLFVLPAWHIRLM